MLHVFHGDDEFSLRQVLDEMKAKLGDETTADLNTTVLDGRSLALDDLRVTCDTLPFLANTRLVIVDGLLARYEPRPGAPDSTKQRSDPLEGGLRAYLPTMPETADLVLVERATISEKNVLLRLVRDLGGRVREFTPPASDALTAWITKRVHDNNGKISPRAAETLGVFVGSNLRQLAQEIDKLLAYAEGRDIKEGDVHLLVADAREVKIWDLTDAVAGRNRDLAVRALHRMLEEGAQPPMLMAMLTRQIRSLVQVKELADDGLSSDEIARQLRVHSFVAKKTCDTARGFSYERLDEIYRRLLDTDLAVKTGRLDPSLALDLLVIELTATRNRP
jgi:DNA polymerase-3 subunit delta